MMHKGESCVSSASNNIGHKTLNFPYWLLCMSVAELIRGLPPEAPILSRLLHLERRLWQSDIIWDASSERALVGLFESALGDPQLELPLVYERVAAVCAVLQSSHKVSAAAYGQTFFALWARTIGQTLESWVYSVRRGVASTVSDLQYELMNLLRYVDQVLAYARIMVWNNQMLRGYIDNLAADAQQLFSPPPPQIKPTAADETDPMELDDSEDDASLSLTSHWPLECKACGRFLVRHVLAHAARLSLTPMHADMINHAACYCPSMTCQSMHIPV